jgi:hypothetical protein
MQEILNNLSQEEISKLMSNYDELINNTIDYYGTDDKLKVAYIMDYCYFYIKNAYADKNKDLKAAAFIVVLKKYSKLNDITDINVIVDDFLNFCKKIISDDSVSEESCINLYCEATL